MKKIFYVLVLVSFTACAQSKKEAIAGNKVLNFGDKIKVENAISAEELNKKYQNLKVGDTLNVKFNSKVVDVCQSKGCWMNVVLDENSNTFVKFKNYAFFMPLDSKGKSVVVEGKAFVSEVSVEEQRHYLEDAGKSKEEIAKITQPKMKYQFLANGVVMNN